MSTPPVVTERCTSCNKLSAVKKCSRCLSTQYCSPSCQKTDWKRGHKNVCTPYDAGKELRLKTMKEWSSLVTVHAGAYVARQYELHGPGALVICMSSPHTSIRS